MRGTELPKPSPPPGAWRQINSEVALEPMVADLSPSNAAELLENIDLILDATDNFETRYLINDFSVRENIPWIYGAAVRATD